MPENDKAKAATLPRIGELIDKETGIKYDTYSKDQKKYGIEAAEAAIVENPEIAQKVYELLKQQADLRTDVVQDDMKKILKGQTLDGIKPGSFFMSDIVAEPADKTTEDPKLKAAHAVADSAGWQVAEGASNISNYVRDLESIVDGKKMNHHQKHALKQGMKAEKTLEHDLATGTVVDEKLKAKLEKRLNKAGDAAATIGGIKPDDANFNHYREKMRENIDSGVEAIKQLKEAGVQQTQGDSGSATYAPAQKNETGKIISK